MTRPARACLDCRRITTNGSRCVDCARRHQTRVDQQRGTRTERGYTNDWLRLVAAAIRAQPYCSVCGATDNLTGDHMIPLSQGGTSTPENIQVLCTYHNSQKGGRTHVQRAGRTVETTMARRGGETRT